MRYGFEGYGPWYKTAARTAGARHLIMLRAPDGSIEGVTGTIWDARAASSVHQQLTAVPGAWLERGLAKR